jgi:F1F0 ATPase subunit 2
MIVLARLPLAASVVLHGAIGVGLGLFYFGRVWRDSRRIAGAERLSRILASMAVRFVVLGGLLTLASLEGAAPLLAAALGVLVGRTVVLRQIRAAAGS